MRKIQDLKNYKGIPLVENDYKVILKYPSSLKKKRFSLFNQFKTS